MLHIDLLEWLGYLASILVLISLLMSSIVKLRWINLLGSIIFAIYGFLIGALPVGLVNSAIAIINIYYLTKIYSTKEFFKTLPIDVDSKYFQYFLEFYHDEIKKYFSNNDFEIKNHTVGFYILRNLVPAGVFLASKHDNSTLLVELDFVIPEYRDFKIGKYIFEEQQDYFLELGYNKLYSYAFSESHANYLKKMGFEKTVEQNKEVYIKVLTPTK
ncbi:MAG: YgjV family protein [Clostridiaceae bacterium]|nr:YgjV family protein [Clostridiaceae bacterium]